MQLNYYNNRSIQAESMQADDGIQFRSINMMTSPDSLMPGPFDLRPAPAAAPSSALKGIVEPDEAFYDFKFATMAKPAAMPEIAKLSMLKQPFGQPFDHQGPTMKRQQMLKRPIISIEQKKRNQSHVAKIILTPELQAQLIPNPTKATYVPPSISGMEIRISGWGPSGLCFVRNLPRIYPNRAKIIRDCSFPLELLAEKTHQVQIYNKTVGFQVIYQENPLKATVQTPDCGEFILDFWVSSSKTDFYLALYAQREVGVETQIQMDHLLKALKEQEVGEDVANLPPRQTFDSNSLERLESYLDNSVQAMEAKRAKLSDKPVMAFKRNVLAEIHDGLMSESWEGRKLAMSLLLHGTDLKSTLGSFACRSAAIVLAGSSLDQAELDNQGAMDIHKTLIQILQEAEFAGDTDRLQQDFSEVPTESSRKRPRFYEDFMSDLHNMAMTILVQSLEVAVCFQQHKDLIQQFVANYYLTDNHGAMNSVFERCIFQVTDPLARHSLSKGYLACKALRILAESNVELRKQVELDDRTKSSILGALQVGESSHWLLHRESKDLHNLIYGQM